jgi:hypothetical protein
LALTRGDEIQIHQENNDHNDHNNNTGNDQDTTGTAAATGGTAGGPGTTNFKLRVEQNKILEFFGSKSKDTISAADFIRQLEDFAKTNRWSDAQTYYHFPNSLRNLAREWISSVVDLDDNEHDQTLWSDFKEIFKQEYPVQTNERLILEGLVNLAMKPNEMTNELLTRITRTVSVTKESFADYGAITLDPHNDINHGISNKIRKRAQSTERSCKRMIQRKQSWHLSHPYWSHFPTPDRCQVSILKEETTTMTTIYTQNLFQMKRHLQMAWRCKRHHEKFIYKSTIKMLAPENFSWFQQWKRKQKISWTQVTTRMRNWPKEQIWE